MNENEAATVKCVWCEETVAMAEAAFIGKNMITGKPMYMCRPCTIGDPSDYEEDEEG
jgi:hypothetical protein